MTGNGKVAALIPAAGSGTRLGLGAKAFVQLDGQSLLARSIEALHSQVDEIIVALPPHSTEEIATHLHHVIQVTGGETRQASVWNMLQHTDAEWVIIHDAARPFLPSETLSSLIHEVKRTGAATLALPVADTLVRGQGNEWSEPVLRDNLWHVQTPQGFSRALLREAHQKAIQDGFSGTDDASLVARLGYTVSLVRGDARLMKITTPADLPLAETLAREQTSDTFFFSPAKINLGLSVLGKRADGYHEIHSIFAALSVGDWLSFERAPWFSLKVRGALIGSDNLVERAALAYFKAAHIPPEEQNVSIVLHKHLPLASGLGGGSSNAAITLLALEKRYRRGIHLHQVAQTLGADVPFFLRQGGALMTGIGEQIMPLSLPPRWLVLANAGDAVSARDAYTWLQEFTPALPLQELLQTLWNEEPLPYFNALQAGVAARVPSIAQTLRALEEAGLTHALMSGSGATCFAWADSEKVAKQAARTLQAAYPHWWIEAAQIGQ